MKEKEPEKPFFYRSDGQKVYVQSISIFELKQVEDGITAEYRERGEPIDPPMYTIKTVGEGEITLPMNATNLIVDGDEEETAKRQLDWDLYIRALGRMKAEIGSVVTDIILEGVVAEPPTQEWIERKRKRHIPIPDDPDELMTMYKMIEVLKTPGDLIKAQQEIVLLSSSGSVRREDVEAAGATFLGQIQAEQGRSTGEVADSGRNGGEATEKPLDTQHHTKRSRRHKGVGDTAKLDGAVQTE